LNHEAHSREAPVEGKMEGKKFLRFGGLSLASLFTLCAIISALVPAA
jgi:hypothetical protein